MEQLIVDGGRQQVLEISEKQVIYLDFDGGLTSYNGEILTIGNVEVEHSRLSSERIKNILAELNEKYNKEKVFFVTEIPEDSEYSTIFIGKTDAFDEYGSFAGLAETVDEDNHIKNDKAFVLLDAYYSNKEIVSAISHEAGHLLGILDHGGKWIDAYAYSSSTTGDHYISRWDTVTKIELDYRLMHILSGGTANSTFVNNGGKMFVSQGGTANSTSINKYGSVYVSSGGRVNFTSIYNSGNMHISQGGVAMHTVVNSGGRLHISSGGVHSGNLWINNGGVVSAYAGAVIEFTIAGRKTSETFVVTNLALIKGSPTYTIVVAANQANGTYKLAQNAGNFRGSILIGTGTGNMGALTVNGGSVIINGNTYSLSNVNGELTLSKNVSYTPTPTPSPAPAPVKPVDRTPPAKPVATLNTYNLTNTDVTVSVAYSSDSAVKQYRIGTGKWQDYTTSFKVAQNCTVQLRAKDDAGNQSISNIIISNIDKKSPMAAGYVETKANGYVISFEGKDDKSLNQCRLRYSLDGKTFRHYTGSLTGKTLTLTGLGKVQCFQIQAIDAAGNFSDWKTLKQVDTLPIVSDDPDKWIFVSTRYNGKTTGKKQSGVTLKYEDNAFSSVDYIVNAAGKTIILTDNINSENYNGFTTVAGSVVSAVFTNKSTSYNCRIAVAPQKTLNITGNTGSTEFIRFMTVNVTGATVGNISGGRESFTDVFSSVVNIVYNTQTETGRTNYTWGTVGRITAAKGARITGAKGYATVNLTGASVTTLDGGTGSTLSTSRKVESVGKLQLTVTSSKNSSASGTVTLKDGSSVVNSITGYSNITINKSSAGDMLNSTSRDSQSDTSTYDSAKKTVTRTVILSHTETTAGTLRATDAAKLGDVTGFAIVNLKNVDQAGDFTRVDENGKTYSTVRETLNIRTVAKTGIVNGTYNKTETITRAGSFTAVNAKVGDIKNYSTVTLDKTSAHDISNTDIAKIVTKATESWYDMTSYGRPEEYDIDLTGWQQETKVTRSLMGSVNMKNGASAESIANFKNLTMTGSQVGKIENVNRVTVNKGDSTIDSYCGTAENDTLTIAAGAVLTAQKIDLGKESRDTLALNGTLILTGTTFKVGKKTGRGEIAAKNTIWQALGEVKDEVLNLGSTSQNFRGTVYEKADDTWNKAVKWDRKEDYKGWMGDWQGAKLGSDDIDYIKFKADAGDVLSVSGVSDWELLDKKGKSIGKINNIAAAGEYILKLNNDKNYSVAYTVTLA